MIHGLCRCNSTEEIRSLPEAHAQFQASLTSANADFESLAQLDRQIKSFNVGPNPYTWFTMEALSDTWKNLQSIIKQRDAELAQEEVRNIFCLSLRNGKTLSSIFLAS